MIAPDPHSRGGIIAGVLDTETIRSSSLYNEDLAPIPATRRSWGTYNYAALWIAMSVNIPTYMLASGMIAGGMSWRQAIFTVFLGNVLVLAPMLLNAHAGAKYGIPFPVFARASFGVLGANVPAVLRALLAAARRRDHAGHSHASVFAGHHSAISVAHRRGAARVGRREGGRLWNDARSAIQISDVRRIFPL